MEAGAGKKILLLLSCILLTLGSTAGPLILRLYFVKGGKRIWLSTSMQTAGWPLTLIFLAAAYTWRRRSHSTNAPDLIILMKARVFLAAIVIGVLSGGGNYLYSYGVSRLPVSTSSLIIATQLAFTAVFAFWIVKQKFTAYSVNAVVLLTAGASVLGVHTRGDRPAGETGMEYVLGFVLTAAAAVVAGLVLPLVELTYMKAQQVVTLALVLEIQMAICFSSSCFCMIGMLINKDFQAIPREAKEYELGEAKYYLVLICTAIILQCYNLGVVGVIFCSSSLLSGIIVTVTLPITQMLAVVFYHEKFTAEKGVALFLSLWGFVSYFYGEMKQNNSKEEENSDDLQHGAEGTQILVQLDVDSA